MNSLARANLEADCWAWSEALHVGPVSRTADLEAFAQERTRVYESLGWDEWVEVEADFKLRNEALSAAIRDEEEIALLFGAGIRDQMPLARLLSWLVDQSPEALERTKLALLDGLLSGESDEALAARVGNAKMPTPEQVEEYRSAWKAFTAEDPTGLELVFGGLESGPLKGALGRLLRECPSSENGLSLTEAQILDTLSLGVTSPADLFESCRETESAPFLTNWEFWAMLERMTKGSSPLMRVVVGESFLCPPKEVAWEEFHSQSLAPTEFGERVMAGEEHYGLADFQERWLGGARLAKEDLWFWDYRKGGLTQSPTIPSVL